MDDQLNQLVAQWSRLGGSVLMNQAPDDLPPITPERLIAQSTRRCRDSSRLTWIVLDWLVHHPDQRDPRQLLDLARAEDDLTVLGLLCDAAREKRPHRVFDWIITECQPAEQEEIFFHRVARSPLASRLVRLLPHELFRRWNFLSDELCYL